MNNEEMTFGEYIAASRKEKGISQKELAQLILKEDGESIAAQYLNDIERGRRNPSSDHLVRQFAEKLELEADHLFYLAGKFPNDIRRDLSPTEVRKAMVSFRRKT